MQSLLDGVVRNKVVYEKISREMEILGFTRTWQQCRTKIKNLTHKYRMVGVIACCASYNCGSPIILACGTKVKDHNEQIWEGQDQLSLL